MKIIILTILFANFFLDAVCQMQGYSGGKIITNSYDNLKYEVLNNDTIVIVDRLPVFPGGPDGLNHWIMRNIKSLKNNIKEEVHGKIIVKWTVQKNGTVSNIRVVKGFRPDIDSIIIAPFYRMPKWQPGYQGTTPVPVVFKQPISF